VPRVAKAVDQAAMVAREITLAMSQELLIPPVVVVQDDLMVQHWQVGLVETVP
jgi:hypothetical protein